PCPTAKRPQRNPQCILNHRPIGGICGSRSKGKCLAIVRNRSYERCIVPFVKPMLPPRSRLAELIGEGQCWVRALNPVICGCIILRGNQVLEFKSSER